MSALIDEISAKLKQPVQDATPLVGGSICNAYKIKIHDQYSVYKSLTAAAQNFFQCETNGLQTLAETCCFKTPDVYAYGDDYIWMQYVAPNTQLNWQQLGAQLARLHQHTQGAYGLSQNNFLATIAQNNSWQESWLDFYREQRLLPLLEHELFNHEDRKRWDKLLHKLDSYLDNSEPPALIHGDLWNTNILAHDNDIYLIDPAVYYASREIEIAYLEFVGDLNSTLLNSYQEAYPLDKNYSERKNLYLLYPYLVHLHLFGQTYLPGVLHILKYYT